MNRYLVFAWENYESEGGAGDFVNDYVGFNKAENTIKNMIENRVKLKNGLRAECGNILDTQTGKVKHYGENSWLRNKK